MNWQILPAPKLLLFPGFYKSKENKGMVIVIYNQKAISEAIILQWKLFCEQPGSGDSFD